MPQYEVSWTETRAFTARVMVPSDSHALAHVEDGSLVGIIWSDLITAAPGAQMLSPSMGEGAEPVVEVKSLGRVAEVEAPVDPNFPDVTTTVEKVLPL